jgi:hypothetical protein
MSYIYKNLVALPPFDDLNVKTPLYNTEKNYKPPHLYKCFSAVKNTA